MATVIFKPTEACNARCIYCEVVKKTRGPKRMTFKTLELFFQRVNEFLVERPQEEMEIIWHGGEPLLLGPGYFERALVYQEKHCSETASRIEHSIQSNLTLLSREFLDPMRRLGITSIGSSYDPISNIRGLGAKRDWRAYNRRFLDAIGLLEEEGFNWGVVYVVTRQSLAKPLEIFNFLTNMSPGRGLRFNPILVYGEGLSHLKISPAEYAEFLGTIFPVWWRHRARFRLRRALCFSGPESGRRWQVIDLHRVRGLRRQPPQCAARRQRLPLRPFGRLGAAGLRLHPRPIILADFRRSPEGGPPAAGCRPAGNRVQGLPGLGFLPRRLPLGCLVRRGVVSP